MYRLIQLQREAARTEIYNKVVKLLSKQTKQYLDDLLDADDELYSPLHTPTGRCSRAYEAHGCAKCSSKHNAMEGV
jgi:hypothetical protein